MPDPAASHRAAAAVLQLSGEIDVARSDAVLAEGEALLDQTPRGDHLVVDVAEVEFIDSSGLSALLRLRRLADERDVTIVLRSVPHFMASVMRVGGLEGVFPTE